LPEDPKEHGIGGRVGEYLATRVRESRRRLIEGQRVPAGTRLEETERLMAKVENIVRAVIPPDELQLMTDHIGLPVYWALLFYQTDTIGPQDADLQIETERLLAQTGRRSSVIDLCISGI
jgi:hypothetical protein